MMPSAAFMFALNARGGRLPMIPFSVGRGAFAAVEDPVDEAGVSFGGASFEEVLQPAANAVATPATRRLWMIGFSTDSSLRTTTGCGDGSPNHVRGGALPVPLA